MRLFTLLLAGSMLMADPFDAEPRTLAELLASFYGSGARPADATPFGPDRWPRSAWRREGERLSREGEKPLSSQLNDTARYGLPLYAPLQDAGKAYAEDRFGPTVGNLGLAALEALPFLAAGRLARSGSSHGDWSDAPWLGRTATAYLSGSPLAAWFGARPSTRTMYEALPKETWKAYKGGKSAGDYFPEEAAAEAARANRATTSWDDTEARIRGKVREVMAETQRKHYLEQVGVKSEADLVPALEKKISALEAGRRASAPDPRALEREGALTLLNEPRGAGNMPSEGLEPAYLRALREFWSMGKPDKLNSLAAPAAGGAGLSALSLLQDLYGEEPRR